LLLGIDPFMISVDQVALYHYCLWMNGKKTIEEKNLGQGVTTSAVVIDLGAAKTVLCGMEGNALRWARTTPMGVDLLIEFLQGELQCSWQEAASLVHNLSGPGELQKKALAMLTRGFSPWINDIEVSLKKAESVSQASLHLCGGARMSLREPLSSALHRNIIVQKELGAVPEGGLSSACFALSVGLALLPSSAVNFRKDEFTHSEEIAKKGGLVVMGVSVFLLLILYLVNISLHAREKEKKFNFKKQELTASFQAAFPETQNIVDEIKQSESMIADIKKRSDLLGIGTPSPLFILKMVTDAIPRGVAIYVNEFTVEGGRVQIEAQTTSFDFVDKIKNALMKVDSFDEVTVGDAQVIADSDRVGFRMQVSVKNVGAAHASPLQNNKEGSE